MYSRYVFYTSITPYQYLTPWGTTSPRVSDAWVMPYDQRLPERPGYRAHIFEVDWGVTADHFAEYMRDKKPGSIMSGWYLRQSVVVIAAWCGDYRYLTVDYGVYPEHSDLDASAASYRSIPKMLDAIVRNVETLADVGSRFKVREVTTGA